MARIFHRISTLCFTIVISALLLQSCSQPLGKENSIIKSANDNRDYHSFVLPNQLKVLVISDPEADMAAASLDVNIGSSANPKDRQGLAHFLEHMLFLGTEKYPETGEYQKFISEHGGSHNAFTSFEHTNYFFDVDKNHLAAALDRFSQFFIAPLFTAEFVDREKHAVNSEYQSKLKDDSRRTYEVLKTIANPDHPFSEFFVGSLKTLSDQSDRTVREDLLDFYQRYYSANLMTLVVLGPQTTQELEALVKKQFSAIPNQHAEPLNIWEPLFLAEQLPISVNLNPVKDIRRLSIQFPLPSLHPYYKSKPTRYIGNLLGHEGKGSLLSYLKEKGWAESLSAGAGHNNSDSATFQIYIALTEKGLQYRDEIIQAVFTQIRHIAQEGVVEWRFTEQQQLAQMGFDFKEKSPSIHYVTGLTTELHYYDFEEVLSAPYLFSEFNGQLIQDILAQLTPENMVVMTTAKELETDQSSQWFNTPYSIEKVTTEQVNLWAKPLQTSVLTLPKANPFVPEDLAVKPQLMDAKAPKNIESGDGLSLWHLQDTSFGTPRADFYFAVRSPLANDTAAHRLLTELYVKAVNEALSEFTYPAYLAGLNYQLYKHVRGLSVRISGYHDKQPILLEEISKTLKQPNISAEKFAIIKDEISRSLNNAKKGRPSSQAINKVSNMVLLSSWNEDELLATMKDLSLEDLQAFIPKYLSKIELVAMANGNLLSEDAQAMAAVLQQTFLKNGQPRPVLHQPANKLPEADPLLYPFQVNHPDSAITIYIQGANKSIDELAKFTLFQQLLSAPFYQELRTVQQRGYVVFATSMTMMDVPAIGLVIQSPNTSAEELARHSNDFLEEFSGQINALTEAEFAKHQNALMTRILEKDTRLSQRSGRYWREIDRENFQFDRREKLAEAVTNYPLQQFKQDYRDYILGSKKRSLTVLANGEGFPLPEDQAKGYKFVKERSDLPQQQFAR